MDLIKAEIENDEDFNAVGFKSQRRNLRVLKQVGRSNKNVDMERRALMPGKRISKTGKVYWETRKNRTDNKGTTI